MNLDSNTDHLYSPSLVTQKNTWQKMWTGYLYSADKISIMSVGWMYCYAALDALQRILSALQDICALQIKMVADFCSDDTHKCIGNIQIKRRETITFELEISYW